MRLTRKSALSIRPFISPLISSHLSPLQLEALQLLSPNQTAEMLLLPLPTPPEKEVVINQVFDFLLESPTDGKLIKVLHYLVQLAKEVMDLPL